VADYPHIDTISDSDGVRIYVDVNSNEDAARFCEGLAAGEYHYLFLNPTRGANDPPAQWELDAKADWDRRLAKFCEAHRACMPFQFALRAAGLLQGRAPPDKSFWDTAKDVINWITDQANKVDFAFVNTQLGILGGQNVGDAIKRDWRNAWESKDIAEDVENGRYKDAGKKIAAKFKSSAEEAGQPPPEWNCITIVGQVDDPSKLGKIDPSHIRQLPGTSSSAAPSLSTGAKVAIVAGVTVGAAAAATAVYGAATHTPFFDVWRHLMRGVRESFARTHAPKDEARETAIVVRERR